MQSYIEAMRLRGDEREALGVLALIGKPQTTAPGTGRLHSVTVKAEIYHQETDGAKNYHNSEALDKAMSQAVREMWGVVSDRAKEILADASSKSLIDAEADVRAMLDKITAETSKL